jgi:hypothetical protein
VTNWPERRKRPLIAASDEELIAGSHQWTDVMPWGGKGDPEWERWSAGFRAWCADRGTDPVELLRLRCAAKVGASTLARLEEEFDD